MEVEDDLLGRHEHEVDGAGADDGAAEHDRVVQDVEDGDVVVVTNHSSVIMGKKCVTGLF